KLEDVATTHTWFVDERFRKRSLKTKEEAINYGLAYNEHRIHNEQVTELMLTYLKELDGLMNKFHEIEKASSENFGEVSDDAKKLKITE
ncbi:DUF1474 family protein, partial [Staphylococcus aureus]|nr:DUF1474 family protein [Staphylococcus aureus]